MTERAEHIIATLRAVLAAVDDHAASHPDEANAINDAAGRAFSERVRLDQLGDPQPREARPSDIRPADALRIFNERTRKEPTT